MDDDRTPPECGAAREALSAVLDREDPGLATDWLTQHLVTCAECRAWYAAAQELHRRTRLLPVPELPDLTRSVLASAEAEDRSAPRWWSRLRLDLPRCGAAFVAAALLWLQGPLLLLGRDPDVGVHPAHELGSFSVALAGCLLAAAVRPEWGRRLAPAFAAVALLLLATAALDLGHGGRTTWADEAPHLLWLAGWVCLRAMRPPEHGDSLPHAGLRMAGPTQEQVADGPPAAARRPRPRSLRTWPKDRSA